MRKIHKGYAACSAMALGLLVFTPLAASADIEIIGSGYGEFGGTTGNGSDGLTWTFNTTSGGYTTGVGANQPAWGMPGLSLGEITYTGTTTATDFDVSFVLPQGVSIEYTSQTAGGYNEETRFEDNDLWTIGAHDANAVQFLAPVGGGLVNGEEFFVNVVFQGATGNIGDETGFSSYFSTVTAVPEPATWAMFLVGFGAVGFMLRGSRRKVAIATA